MSRHCLLISTLVRAINLDLHVFAIFHAFRLCVNEVDTARVGGVNLIGGEYLNEENLFFLKGKKIYGFFPITLGEEVRNNNGKTVIVSKGQATDYGFVDIGVAIEIDSFQTCDGIKEGALAYDNANVIFRNIPLHQLKGYLVHVVDGEVAERCCNGNGVVCLFGCAFAHGGGAVQENLRVHLTLIGEQFEEEFFKAAVKIPVDATNIVTQHIFAVVREFYGLTVGSYQVLTETSKKYVRLGASPRAGQALISAAKVKALMKGRFNVSYSDIDELALPVLRHRIKLTFEAAAERISADQIVEMIVDEVHGRFGLETKKPATETTETEEKGKKRGFGRK